VIGAYRVCAKQSTWWIRRSPSLNESTAQSSHTLLLDPTLHLKLITSHRPSSESRVSFHLAGLVERFLTHFRPNYTPDPVGFACLRFQLGAWRSASPGLLIPLATEMNRCYARFPGIGSHWLGSLRSQMTVSSPTYLGYIFNRKGVRIGL
jgi:hypothetical protein